jgi:hypothetical protein
MNASIDDSKDGAEDSVHEATESLNHLADEVERERAERGRSDLDQIHLSDGEELAEQLGVGGPDPDPDEQPKSKDEPGNDGIVPVQNGLTNPH